MKQRAAFWLLFSGVIAAALFLRCGDLSLRPLHNDEAINAFKLRKLWSEGIYRYDPHEYHGPALYYFSVPVLAVASLFQPDQPDEVSMRAVPLVFGVLLLLTPLVVMGAMGRAGVLFAGLLGAVSPAFVYFSRYYIHELLLVFFTAVFLVGLWRYRMRPGPGWAALIGAAMALMYATKETFVFALGATVCGLVCAGLGPVRFGRAEVPGPWLVSSGGAAVRGLLAGVRRVPRVHWLIAAAVAFVVAVLFFSSFLSNPGGVLDALRTYLVWFQRAGGATPHVHPWYFYFQRLLWFRFRGGPAWTESVVLGFSVIGLVIGWCGRWARTRRGEMARFLAGFSLSLAGVYAVLPYKTPWCLLGFYHGLVLLAGLGLGAVWDGLARAGAPVGDIQQGEGEPYSGPGLERNLGSSDAGVGARPRKSLSGRIALAGFLVVVVTAGACHLGWQSWRSTREFAADFRNPYVYGHTSQDFFNLLELIRGLSRAHADGRGMPVEVVAPGDDYWPLPWYLRDFSRVGWWSKLPEKPVAPVLVVASKLQSNLEEHSGEGWLQAGMFELRPRFFVEVYVQGELWKKFLARNRPEP